MKKNILNPVSIKNVLSLLICILFTGTTLFAQISITKTDASCDEAKDGSATASVTGGTAPYTFAWSNGGTGPSISGLSPGTYTVTVTDANNCSGSKSIDIIALNTLTLSISGGNAQIEFCSNASPPSLTLTASASGGEPPYNYSWPGASLTVNASGTYTCSVTDKNGCIAHASAVVVFIPVQCAADPNAIAGVNGYGEPQWVSVNDKLTYTVFYENDPDFATAPAQEVKINVPISDKADKYSLRIGDFGFGDFIFSVPPNTSFYTKRLDVVDSLGVYVDVIAGLDVVNDEAFWVLKSIDPETGLPPNDPQTGFLPVNDSVTHKGEGFVTFVYQPGSSDQTGDSILAHAEIIFDINAPIGTNVWFNTVDAFPPESYVDPLPPAMGTTSFDLTVTGTDDFGGCGISKYQLWVSKDSEPFNLSGEFDYGTTAHFTGIENSTYGFFSIAKDFVGNTEPMKTVPDVSITLGLFSLTPSIMNVTCYSYNNGAINLTVNGGTPPYTYLWSNAATTKDISNLTAGNYSVTVTDSHLLTINGDYQVTQPPEWSIDFTGPLAVCSGTGGNQYCAALTDPSNPAASYSYQWIVNGGTVTEGQGTDCILVTWSAGSQGSVDLSVTRSGDGCNMSKMKTITINPIPVPPLTGPTSVCNNSSNNIYLTTAGMSNYQWTIPAGAIVMAGGGSGDNTVNLKFTTVGTKIIKVNYTDGNGCTGAAPTQLIVTVKPSPVPVITGPASCCVNVIVTYSTTPFQTNYVWEVSPGDEIKSGQGTKLIKVEFKSTGARWVKLSYTGANGCPASLPTVKNITVTSCKTLTIDAVDAPLLTEVQPINSNEQAPENISLSIYPNPNDGSFTVVIASPEPDIYNLHLYSNLGIRIYESIDLRVDQTLTMKVDVRNIAEGIYTMVLSKNDFSIHKRIIIRK